MGILYRSTIVTLDADFHALLAAAGAAHPSVIRIRIEGLRGEAVARIVDRVVQQGAADLEAGVAVSVQEGRIRWRSRGAGRCSVPGEDLTIERKGLEPHLGGT